MNWFYLVRMMHDRQKELQAESAPEWLMKGSSRKRSPIIVQVRHWLGKRLMVWGWWLVGEKPAGQNSRSRPTTLKRK